MFVGMVSVSCSFFTLDVLVYLSIPLTASDFIARFLHVTWPI